jgi:hypothetical protein
MRIKTMNIYTAAELKTLDDGGAAFARAFRGYLDGQDRDGLDFEISDLMGSLKGLFNACSGVRLADWNTGVCNRNNGLRVDFTGGRHYDSGAEVSALSGPRAIAWLENNLLAGLRIGWTEKRRAELRKYGPLYYPGKIKPCPFTGMCYDDDLLSALVDNVRGGMDLKAAFEDLADVAARLLELANDYQRTEEYFMDEAAANGREYDENGNRI